MTAMPQTSGDLPERNGRRFKKHKIYRFDPNRILTDPNNPRTDFPRIPQLAQSIKANGQRAPGEVTLVENDPDHDAMLVSGERRIRACRLAGVKFRAFIVPAMSPSKRMENALSVNFHQVPHTHLEIAFGLHKLQMLRKKEEKKELTQKEIGRVFGKSNFWVSTHMSLLKLSPRVHELMRAPTSPSAKIVIPSGNELPVEGTSDKSENRKKPYCVSYPIARLLSTINDKEEQVRLAEQVYDGEMPRAQARRLILKQTTKRGTRSQIRDRSPGEASMTFGSKLQTIKDYLGTYTDLDFVRLSQIFSTCEPSEIRENMSILENIREGAIGLAESLRIVLRKKTETRMNNLLTHRRNV